MFPQNNGAATYQSVGAQSIIETADQHKLVEMLYTGAISRINAAKSHLEMGNVANKGKTISNVIAIVEELRRTLDMEHGGELANNLHDLYEYMKSRLLQANLNNDADILDEVKGLLEKLLDGWQQIPEEARQAYNA